MITETRKQREIRSREGKILQVALDHLVKTGYLGLNMDRIATEIEYSKGTIYQHFRNKEEILIALANQALETRTRMFAEAARFDGPNRVRIATVGAAAEAFFEQFPHFFMVEQIVRASSIWEKTSPERREVMEMCERKCMATIVTIVHDAVDSGELVLPDGLPPEAVVFGLWAINFGAQTIASSSTSLSEIGIDDPMLLVRENENRMLDGYHWGPLSTEFDYHDHMDRVKQERFRHDQFAQTDE